MFDGSATSLGVTGHVTDDIVPPGMRPHEAVYRVRTAVEAIPGAGWVSVDYSGLVPPDLPWIVLHRPGSSAPLEAEKAGDLAARVEATVRRALG